MLRTGIPDQGDGIFPRDAAPLRGGCNGRERRGRSVLGRGSAGKGERESTPPRQDRRFGGKPRFSPGTFFLAEGTISI